MNKSKDEFPQQDLDIKRPRAIRMVTVIAVVLSVVVLIATATVGRWAVQGRDVLEIKNDPVPVRTIRDHPEADGVVILKVDYCKKLSVTGKVRASFRGTSREIFLPPAEDKQQANCNNGTGNPIEIPVLIPADITPGHYSIHFRIDYKVNPLKNTVEEFDSQEFEITAHPNGDKSIPGTKEM